MLLPSLILCLSLNFQGPPKMGENLEEVRETIRFIRLAESKKRLDLSEDKLLQVNDLLDDYEARKFDLKQSESKLQREARINGLTDETSAQILDRLLENKKELMELDIKLFENIRGMLTPQESVAFFVFYETFQREVQRRVRNLMRERMNNRRPFRKKP